MNAPERLPTTAAAPIVGAMHLPVTLCVPSATNPRHRPQDQAALQKRWKLNELAESIKHQTLLEPIVVRPRPDLMLSGVLELGADGVYVPSATKRTGEPLYEIVAGERRWRATQLAGLPTIQAVIRVMTDFEVRAAQLVENKQREDLHPIEEGDGYRNMLRKQGDAAGEGFASVDELAAHIGMSRRYVYNRIKLCDLCPEARDAFYDDKINASVALLLARMEDIEQQKQATAEIVQGWAGEPFTFRSAAAHLKKNFMLELGKATFDIVAAYKVAGACTQCTKRSGANPDLFEDVGKSDMCQDRTCYEAKTAEARELQVEKARQAGAKVITGDAAKKMAPSYYGNYVTGHQALDAPARDLTGSDKPLSELLGPGFKDRVVIDNPDRDELLVVAPVEAVKKALKAKGLLKAPAAKPSSKPLAEKPMTPKELEARKERIAEEIFGKLTFDKMGSLVRADAQLPITALRLLANWALSDLSSEATTAVYRVFEWKEPSAIHETGKDLQRRIERASARELGDLLVMQLMAEECTDFQIDEILHDLKGGKPRTNTGDLAKEYGVDLKALHNKALIEAGLRVQEEQEQRLATAKPAVKKAAKPSVTPLSALKAAVAANQEGGGGEKKGPGKVTAKSAGKGAIAALAGGGAGAKKEQKDEAAAPLEAAGAASEQTDDAATPRRPRVGERWRVKATVKGRSKTAGREGTVDLVALGRVTLRWGPKSHEGGGYAFDEIEPVDTPKPNVDEGDKPLPLKSGGTISATAAWPFPSRRDS